MKPVTAVVIDDNELNRKLVVNILSMNGVDATGASDSNSGWIEVDSRLPDLIVIDVMMPGERDGVELCRHIRRDPRFANTAIVMVTAADRKKEAERAHQAGANILIPKPFLPKEFWRQVADLIEKPEGARVFILDDDEKEAELAKTVLAREGYEVMVRLNARGTMADIKEFKPALILVDVMMPELPGDDFVKVVQAERNLKPKPAVLLYSNRSKEDLRELAAKSGADGHIRKTDGPRALLREIRNALSKS